MNANTKLSYAIAAILGGSAMGAGVAHADTATATDTSESEGISNIIHRREFQRNIMMCHISNVNI